jgi:PAS domain S-box-containing protein
MAELSPLGMSLFSPEGVLLEANDRYYEMTGHPRDDQGGYHWMEFIAEGSRVSAKKMWDLVKSELKPGQEEVQIINPNAKPRDLHGEPIEYWVLASVMPEVGMNGEVLAIMGSLADISHMEWAQGLQERRLKEAQAARQAANSFSGKFEYSIVVTNTVKVLTT